MRVLVVTHYYVSPLMVKLEHTCPRISVIWSAHRNGYGLKWNWLKLIEQRPTVEHILHSPFHLYLLLCCIWKKSFIYFHLIRSCSSLSSVCHAKPKEVYFYTEWIRGEQIDVANTMCASYAYHVCAYECVQKRELPLWHCNIFRYVDHPPPTHTKKNLSVPLPVSDFWWV